jgi:hypothetical protein
MARQIVITVGLDGVAKVDAVGFEGKACERATRNVLDALGSDQNVRRKPEYHKEAKQQQSAGR